MNIIELAKDAHRELVTKDYPGHRGQLDPWTMKLLERFAALVRAETIKELENRADGSIDWRGENEV